MTAILATACYEDFITLKPRIVIFNASGNDCLQKDWNRWHVFVPLMISHLYSVYDFVLAPLVPLSQVGRKDPSPMSLAPSINSTHSTPGSGSGSTDYGFSTAYYKHVFCGCF